MQRATRVAVDERPGGALQGVDPVRKGRSSRSTIGLELEAAVHLLDVPCRAGDEAPSTGRRAQQNGVTDRLGPG